MLENADTFFEQESIAAKKLRILPCPNKYAFLAMLVAFGHGLGFDDMLTYIRRWFPVLKCFIYGRNDNRIPEPYLNQTAIYYCHKRKLDDTYEERIRKVLSERYGVNAVNVQERFIFNIEGGKHSLHVQAKMKPLISNIINEYLSILETVVHTAHDSK